MSGRPARDLAVHPQREIAEAIAECALAGLPVPRVAGRYTWGQVTCPTGSRALAVPLVSRDPALHARRIRVFLAEHRGHSLEGS